ncbi:J domain-containing protein [Alkaliphilus transvaalensis]|uniref:J domain-containing protein n=1 Tax=Alkaliphilus transvaalensis TaxID=114628 RepID=UPI00047D6228|nr:DnaJ domain-containing protein [Alkaliphilus transvaalensis]
MKFIKGIVGKILYGIGRVVSVILEGLITLIENLVVFVGSFFKGCLAVASMGGCLFFILFANLGLRILFNPVGFSIIIFMLTFLIMGGRIAYSLKYVKYITTEYLFNTANALSGKTGYQYKKFNEFKEAYRRAEEERIRESQRRYYEQQRQWEERIKQQWYQQQSQQRGQYHYGNFGGQGGYQQGYGHGNPTVDFKNKFERSCDVIGVSYDSDKAQIKSAYRKKAKEYHPDLSKAPDATKIFQEITAAYEFLSDENIQRYKSM